MSTLFGSVDDGRKVPEHVAQLSGEALLEDAERNVLFLEDDCVLREDALVMQTFLDQVKSSRSDVTLTSLAGWAGTHLVHPHPFTAVVQQQTFPFPTMGYSFNASFWR